MMRCSYRFYSLIFLLISVSYCSYASERTAKLACCESQVPQDALERALHATVTVRVYQDTQDLPLPEEISANFLELFRNQLEGLDQQHMMLGSGFVIEKNAGYLYIVTNYHVVQSALRQADTITVSFFKGSPVKAKLIGTDVRSDLAVLRVKEPVFTDKIPALSWAASQKAKLGEPVFAIGAAYGLSGTVTHGIISCLNRRDLISENTTHVNQWLQTDAAVNKGNSGGPLINRQGLVLGVNTAIMGNRGISFSIPADIAQGIIQQLIQKGCVKRSYIGVFFRPQDIEGSSSLGAMIEAVSANSPAARGGLKARDIIVAINQNEIQDVHQARSFIGALPPGTSVTVTIQRPSVKEPMKVELVTEEMPQRTAFLPE